MNTFFLNNSSFQYLACSKRYYFQVVKGLKPPPGGNKYTTAGLAFHKMMQIVGTDKCPQGISAAYLLAKPTLPKIILSIPEAQALQLATLADRIHTEHPEMFGPDVIREHYFEYCSGLDTYTPDDTGSVIYRAIRSGTIDHISILDNTVVLTDYKTTSKPIDGGLDSSYSLTSQRWFYTEAAPHLKLPENFMTLIRAGRVAWRYCYVGIEKDNYLLKQPEFLPLEEAQVFARLFNEKALLAAALHSDHSLAVKEGILSNQCWRCPYSSLCLAADEKAAVENWYYGSEPYNPKHNDE